MSHDAPVIDITRLETYTLSVRCDQRAKMIFDGNELQRGFNYTRYNVFAPVSKGGWEGGGFAGSDVPTLFIVVSLDSASISPSFFFPIFLPSPPLIFNANDVLARFIFFAAPRRAIFQASFIATETPIIHIKKYQHDNRKTFTHSRVISDYLLLNLAVSRSDIT